MNVKTVAHAAWSMVLVSVVVVSLLVAGILPVMAQGDDDLTETFVSGGILEVSYPAGWYVDEPLFPGFVLLASSQEAADVLISGGMGVPDGEVMMFVVDPTVANMLFDGEEPASAEDALAMIMQDGSSEYKYADPEEVVLGDWPALISRVTGTQSEGITAVLEVNGTLLLASVETPKGEFVDWEETTLAILASVSYAAQVEPGEMIPFESEDGTLTFEYPFGWMAMDFFEGTYLVMNKFSVDDVVPTGTVRVTLITPDGLPSYNIEEGDEEWTDLGQLLNTFVNFWLDGDSIEVSDPAEAEVGNYSGMMLEFTVDTQEGFVLALEIEDAPFVVWVQTVAGELISFEDVVVPLIESLDYVP